jgi:hypothetical protein
MPNQPRRPDLQLQYVRHAQCRADWQNATKADSFSGRFPQDSRVDPATLMGWEARLHQPTGKSFDLIGRILQSS